MTQPGGSFLSLTSQGKNPATEVFKGVIREGGVRLASGDEANDLHKEQALAVRDIERALDNGEEGIVDRFLRGFRVLIKREKYMKKALLPCSFRKSSDDSDGGIPMQQESLFRIFLKVDQLQPHIVDILLDELTATVSEDEQDTPHLRLLLSQLRYLPHIRHPRNLTTKLLDIIDVAPFPSQLEILDSIPEILPDSEYEETAKKLGVLLEQNDELSAPIIDCLNTLNLEPEHRAQIQDSALSRILLGTKTDTFPVLLDFLLTDVTAKNVQGTLTKIRNALEVILGEKGDKEKETTKVVVFRRLERGANVKVIAEGWISLISNIKMPNDHKPIDLLLLFMLHSNTKLKKRSIETLLRKRVKEGLFKCSLLEQLFEKCFPLQMMRDYFASVLEIGGNLLRTSTDVAVTEFAATVYKLMFCHKHTETVYKQEIIENLILLAFSSDQKNITAILTIFSDLVEEISKTPNHAIILMRLLEKVDTFKLKDVKLVFEVLCRIICRDETLHGLKEELHMLVRKQLSTSKRALKHRGIISAVVMAKHIAATSEEQSLLDSDESILGINQLEGAAREAASILTLADTSTTTNTDLVGLYYDQLASMLRKVENLNRNFLCWLFETITNDFQTIFVTEKVCDDVGDLRFAMQYNLNNEEEIENPIGVNIAEMTLKSDRIGILAPNFRLLRLLHQQQHGDLSSIDALLGCGVVLPEMEHLESLDADQLRQVTDCIFHSINWFREVISAFVPEKNKKLRTKVLQRLDTLIELERLLQECMEGVPNHKLPQSYFETTAAPKSSPKPPPRKKLKSKELVDDSVAAPSTSAAVKPKKSTSDEHLSFRDIDIDVISLVRYPLAPSDHPHSLSYDQLNFLLKDFCRKLEAVIKGTNLGMSDLVLVKPEDLMKDCVNILLNINKHFSAVEKIIDNDEVESGVKSTFGLILECLALVFSWQGFHHTKRLDLLRDILKALQPEQEDSPASVKGLVQKLSERMALQTDHCHHLSNAVNLIKIMENLNTISPGIKVSKTAEKLLKRHWETHNAANIDILVKAYFSDATIKTLHKLVGEVQEQAPMLQNKTDFLPDLKSITKANLFVLYRNLWTTLHERVKVEVQALTNAQHLTLWRTVASTMQGLMTVAKAHETRNNLSCFLKKCIAILKIFLSHGIPILEIELKSKPDQVVEILKTVQSNTRYLHHLCCYSKITKDSSLMSHVPQFRLTLETLVYRVKAALVANGCSAAFWMGNLKNRDLHGEDILSQSTVNSTRQEDDEEEEEEEGIEDEDMSDEDAATKSSSEVYD